MKSAFGLIALPVSVTLLAGCVTMLTSPAIAVSPASIPGQKWTISGTIHNQAIASNMFTGTLFVYINGKDVASGHVGVTPSNITGTYENHTIQTVCPAGGGPQNRSFSCQIYVDGALTAVLPFG